MSKGATSMRGAGGARNGLLIAAILSAALAAGCAKRDHIAVGSIPDDYRTNHPIVLAERERTLDLPVGVSEHRLDAGRRAVLAGFLEDYDPASGAAVRIQVPYGSANQHAASQLSGQMADVMRRQGVPSRNILIEPYHVEAPDASAPVRIAYTALTAGVDGQCGRWPQDLLQNADNRHYANFGCSYQNNIAAQVANPADLIGPRKTAPVDPENRGNAIDQYKNRGIVDDMIGMREVHYAQ